MPNVSGIIYGAVIGALVLSSAVVNGLVAVKTSDAVAAPRSQPVTIIQMTTPAAEHVATVKPLPSSSSATVAEPSKAKPKAKPKAKRKKAKTASIRFVLIRHCGCNL